MDGPAQEPHADGIAVIGLAGRFPKARNCDEFWNNLVAGRECLSEFDQAALQRAGIRTSEADSLGRLTRGVVDDADLFDAALFGLSPREAEVMDPQQRIFLEVAWEAIEHAGYDFDRPPGSIGVFVGCGINTYYMSNLSTRPDVLDRFGILPTILLNEKDFLATRLAYRLNLRGPALSIQTACSTSLVAVCHACQSLLNYECDMALAGAAHLAFPQCQSIVHCDGGMTSQDGHCRPFDHRASGTIFSDGVGVVALRRVEDAIADGDNILAVIRGYGLNNDGFNKAGFTAPSVQGQADVIKIAQAFGDIDPATISYIEAHGTGTRLGDPIEIAGLTQAFRAGTDRTRFCGIGSVKSNIGHLDVAAGVAGLIKTVLALHHGKLPATINFESPNPEIDFDSTPFYVVDSLMDWPASDEPRRAGVSSFGIGGTNAHVVLEEAPRCQTGSSSRAHQLLVLSAQSPQALEDASQHLASHLEKNLSSPLSDVAFTLQTGRHTFAHRKSLVCQDPSEAARALREGTGCRLATSLLQRRNAKPVFMFPGQGAQRVNMGRDLYEREQVFRETVDLCARILEPELGLDIRDILFPDAGNEVEAQERLTQTWLTQPALFVTEFAVAKLWQSWGIQPQAMIGHSVGEYTAACLANVFSLETGLKLIAARGRLIQKQPSGSMLAIMRSESECKRLISNSISIAAVNAPSLCVVAGESEEIDSLADRLQRDSIVSRRLQTSHAFHSTMMEPVIAPFAKLLSDVQLSPPTIPFISNVTGKWIEAHEATSSDYWTTHLRSCVKFAEGVETVLNTDNAVLIEVGPGQTLTTLSKQHPAIRVDQVVVTSLPASRKRPGDAATGFDAGGGIEPDQANMLAALGQLWQADVPIDWNAFYQREQRRRVPLPSYPFQRKRYWIEPGRRSATRSLPLSTECNLPTSSESQASALDKSTTLVAAPLCTAAAKQLAGTKSFEEEVQQQVVAVLHDISGVSEAVLRKPCSFSEMGFDSLFLVQLSHRIKQRLHVTVTFRQLQEEVNSLQALTSFIARELPTSTTGRSPGTGPARHHELGAAGFASSDRRDAPVCDSACERYSTLQEIQPWGDGPPLFCVHAADGFTRIYHDLADALGKERPLIGIDSPAVLGMPLPDDIESLAAQAVRDIREMQPHGPYLLAGYCLGGTVALEMAQQLMSDGEDVAFLGMIETYDWKYAPSGEPTVFTRADYTFQRIQFHLLNFLQLSLHDKQRFIDAKWLVARSRVKVWRDSLLRHFSSDGVQRTGSKRNMAEIWNKHERLAQQYEAREYPGHITLFRPRRDYRCHRTEEFRAERGVEICRLDAYPAGTIVDPYVKQLAREINLAIEKGLERYAPKTP